MDKPQFNVKLLEELAFDPEETAANGCGVDCTFNGAVKTKPKTKFFKTVD